MKREFADVLTETMGCTWEDYVPETYIAEK